ncbi:MAG: ATP-binding protein [Treponema sp.]|nr:ATP-binding protein [Treponema sp.]
MQMVCTLLVALGAGIMLFSIAKFYKALKELKVQMKAKKLFIHRISLACFIMMLFFLAGYVVNIVIYSFKKEMTSQDLLIALIFFFGAVFVYAMVGMVRQMFATMVDKLDLKKRLKQEELMSTISQYFTTAEDIKILIPKALKISGEFFGVNHVFLSKYSEESSTLECLYEWCDNKARPFIGGKDKWPITKDMHIFSELTIKGYVAVDDYRLLTHPNFKQVEDYNLRAFLNIPVEVSGKFWGVLGFIFYNTPAVWSESNIYLGKLIAGIFSGVINRHMAEEELIKAKEMAEQGSKSKSEFLSRMSHEMRTPMNAVIGMTRIGLDSPEIQRKDYCLGKIELASTHLLGVINDVLDMSKIEANKLELSCADFSPEKMLARVINVVNFQIEEKQLHLNLSVDKDIPEIISSDEQRLSQVITNLLGNAIKFTPVGGTIFLFVRKLAEQNGTCTLQFEVKDTGIGISGEQLRNLFKPFEQADGSISRRFGGTGLGLAISKQIIELMQGEIRVKSAVGIGTSFIFDIHAALPQQVYSQGDLAGKPAGASVKYDFSRIKMLVAEDIEINREIIGALLEPDGISIDFAVDGGSAFNLFSANPEDYDIIFMDIHMPNVNGYEATRMIRDFDHPCAKTIPIIAMTADVFREDIEKCIKAGMNDHVGKPLDMDKITEKLIQYCTHIYTGIDAPLTVNTTTANAAT